MKTALKWRVLIILMPALQMLPIRVADQADFYVKRSWILTYESGTSFLSPIVHFVPRTLALAWCVAKSGAALVGDAKG
ncbi:hypothetical protein [Salinicola salarius]|uniref:hypothetical protein n=1 Tax=Salinicola salarius TaxID=430457 RepID=UPI0013003CF6|nr:hypothetical protein [Salinicola salarius]MDF3918564.1 hypothetical protein [Salinicola salarius]